MLLEYYLDSELSQSDVLLALAQATLPVAEGADGSFRIPLRMFGTRLRRCTIPVLRDPATTQA